MNSEFDQVLDIGHSKKHWLQFRQDSMLTSPYGKTVLIDYRDNSTLGVNCVSTLFGHGIYTQFVAMNYTIKTICDNLY
jgi:hypothetical protein